MGDGGIGAGAALAYLKRKPYKIKDVYLGPEFSDKEIEKELKRYKLKYTRPKNLEKDIAKILVKGNKATGVKLADGSEHRADTVVSAADGHSTIFDMLDKKYLDDTIKGYYEELPIFPSLVFVGIGVARPFDDITPTVSLINFPLAAPLTIGGRQLNRLTARVHNFDPTLAPKGKTALTVFFDSDYHYWKELKNDPDKYKAEKEDAARNIIKALDQRFPGLADQVEMYDVATPVTFERYTGNWQGAYEGWLITTKNLRMHMKKTLPGLDNFYMIGQWVVPGGGLPTGVMTGRHVMQIICKRDGKKFLTTLPQGSGGNGN